MTLIEPVRVLLLPGWHNSSVGHWQSRWEILHGDHRVEQNDWLWPRRGDWMARLDEVLLDGSSSSGNRQRAVLVAHSLGCHLVAAWAAHSKHTDRVVAALLVAPSDTERSDTPPNLFNWRPIVRAALPFASQVISSSNDPNCTPDRAAQLAANWGSDFVTAGARGHINADSDLGDWPQGRSLLSDLLERGRECQHGRVG